MLVLSVNKILKWCQITSGGRSYTCPTKEISGQLCFRFKNIWHPIADFIAENAHEMVEEGGITLIRSYRK